MNENEKVVENQEEISQVQENNATVTKTDDNNWPWLFLLSGIIYFWIMYSRYRNSGARHSHETETKTNMTNLREYDKFVTKRKRLDNSTMEGANNTRITGNSNKLDFKEFLKE